VAEQPLDLKTALRMARRHLLLVVVAAVVGLGAGVGYALVKPPLYTSEALVVLSSSARDTTTELVIARSDPVLTDARLDPHMSLERLRSYVHPKSLAYNLIAISAKGKSATQAEATANAVADSYVKYLSSGTLPGGAVRAHVLQPATDASAGSPRAVRLALMGAIGAVLAGLLGALVAVSIGRSDRRLRQRDEIAQSAGVPVLASISVGRPGDAAAWKTLLEKEQPAGIDSVRLRRALENLGLLGPRARGSSLTVLSLAGDPKAVAVGPRVAALSAALGVPTALVIGQQRDPAAAAALRAACGVLSADLNLMKHLRLVVTDDYRSNARRWNTLLAVVVAVVDEKTPPAAASFTTTANVLGVTAGLTTAEQLKRVVRTAGDGGRSLDGVIVVDPDRGDPTTGRLTRWASPATRPLSEQSG